MKTRSLLGTGVASSRVLLPSAHRHGVGTKERVLGPDSKAGLVDKKLKWQFSLDRLYGAVPRCKAALEKETKELIAERAALRQDHPLVVTLTERMAKIPSNTRSLAPPPLTPTPPTANTSSAQSSPPPITPLHPTTDTHRPHLIPPAEPTKNGVTNQLQEAIKTVSEKRLREIVVELVQTEPVVERALTKLLASSGKRKSRLTTCPRCQVEYEIGENGEYGQCLYHPGELIPDWTALEGYDYDETTIELDKMKRDFPELYKWACCGDDGSAEGCQSGTHVHGRALKRIKV
ncbi:hypothetical protein DACRYDRAFT_118936 [Dacryopinax primogenitus]|uniref:Uncharacterized protein n=1 Tax=Dacryopinax primogenitus (strain DJM 731) TaxID=1858805 RepID=M5FXJ9_DACPD|nr:uncharacterized protein DACRYDRAFT_118936 [Dacryopinax primogenitus]EJT98216.1 hypothetical protein DACRYDRAFT_118936 [Dacryopinax primogenitus]